VGGGAGGAAALCRGRQSGEAARWVCERMTPVSRPRSREAGIVAQKMNAQADKIHERKLRDEMLQEQKMEQRTRRLTKEGLLPA